MDTQVDMALAAAMSARQQAHDAASADLAALNARLLAQLAAAQCEAASWQARHEHLQGAYDFLRQTADVVSVELVRIKQQKIGDRL